MEKRAGGWQAADVRILGEGSFVEAILRQAEMWDRVREDAHNEWSPEDLRRTIADFSGVDETSLSSRDCRRSVTAARAMFAYAAKEWLGMSGVAIGQWLNMQSGSITNAQSRGRRLAEERQLFAHLKLKK
jgi:chromosomal replication initiation ATPase DnaA